MQLNAIQTMALEVLFSRGGGLELVLPDPLLLLQHTNAYHALCFSKSRLKTA